MIARSVEIDEELHLRPFPTADAADACQRAEARIWIDLEAFEPAELEGWLDALAIGGLARRLCLESVDRPGFYPLKKEIVLVIPLLVDEEDSSGPDFAAFVCRENLLLTLHRQPLPQLADLEDSESWLSDRSIAALVSAALIDVSVAALRRTESLRHSVRALEERMDREPDTVEAEEILDTRAELLELASVVADQLPVLRALGATDTSVLRLAGANVFMNCAQVNLQAADSALGSLDARVGALRSGFQMHAQDKTNRRLGMLTILSAVFMPITLLAGIWGMNFEVMPELKHPFAYPLALGFMAAVGAGMYFFFRRTGWFD
jgi:magnesium transporter